MVRGQVATIPAGTGQLLTTLSREEKESVSILNPNDGVVYLRLNGPASIAPTNWDWKVLVRAMVSTLVRGNLSDFTTRI